MGPAAPTCSESHTKQASPSATIASATARLSVASDANRAVALRALALASETAVSQSVDSRVIAA